MVSVHSSYAQEGTAKKDTVITIKASTMDSAPEVAPVGDGYYVYIQPLKTFMRSIRLDVERAQGKNSFLLGASSHFGEINRNGSPFIFSSSSIEDDLTGLGIYGEFKRYSQPVVSDDINFYLGNSFGFQSLAINFFTAI
jgi:hypothetical protein